MFLGEKHILIKESRRQSFVEKIESDLASSFIMNPGFQAAEEKGMEGTQYWTPPGDKKFSAVKG